MGQLDKRQDCYFRPSSQEILRISWKIMKTRRMSVTTDDHIWIYKLGRLGRRLGNVYDCILTVQLRNPENFMRDSQAPSGNASLAGNTLNTTGTLGLQLKKI